MKDIYYEIQGEGYPVVLLHGINKSHKDFYEFIKKYPYFKYILIDLRYHGKSSINGQMNYDELCDDVRKVLKELGIDHYLIIGEDIGANIALKLSSQNKTIDEMFLISPYVRLSYKPLVLKFFLIMRYLLFFPFTLYHKNARKLQKQTRLALRDPHLINDLKNIQIPSFIIFKMQDLYKKENIKMLEERLMYKKIMYVNGETILYETNKDVKLIIDEFMKGWKERYE